MVGDLFIHAPWVHGGEATALLGLGATGATTTVSNNHSEVWRETKDKEVKESTY
jgi:hypothetical protein